VCQCDELTTLNYHAHKLLTTILSLTNYCQEVFRPRLKFPRWAVPTLIFSSVGACPSCPPPPCRRPCTFSFRKLCTLLHMQLMMFWLIYVTMNIKNVPCVSNAGMETSAPLINAVDNNALFHSN